MRAGAAAASQGCLCLAWRWAWGQALAGAVGVVGVSSLQVALLPSSQRSPRPYTVGSVCAACRPADGCGTPRRPGHPPARFPRRWSQGEQLSGLCSTLALMRSRQARARCPVHRAHGPSGRAARWNLSRTRVSERIRPRSHARPSQRSHERLVIQPGHVVLEVAALGQRSPELAEAPAIDQAHPRPRDSSPCTILRSSAGSGGGSSAQSR